VRVVSFKGSDSLAQRHRAVGLVIAAYVTEHEAESRTSEKARPPPAPIAASGGRPEGKTTTPASEPARPGTPAPVATDDERGDASEGDHDEDEDEDDDTELGDEDDARGDLLDPHAAPVRVGVDLALLAGTALDRGPPRVGLALRGFLRPESWAIGGTVALGGSGRLAASDDETATSLQFFWGAIGALLHLDVPKSQLAFGVRAELLAERLLAGAEAPITQLREGDGRLRLGGQVGAEAHLEVGGGFGLFLGGAASLLRPAVTLEIAGKPVGRTAPVGLSGALGVRWAR
jgi:hypothetical protein